MSQRSFKLANTAEKAKVQLNFWASEPQLPSSSEPNPDKLSTTEVLDKDEGTAVSNSSSPEDEQNFNTETPRLRKAIPVKNSTAIKPLENPLRPKPVLKPKPQQTERATEKQDHSYPNPTDSLTLTSKRIEAKAAPFGERYERITTYLEKPLFRRVHDLHQRGEINKITNLLNAAVKEYLNQHYPSA
ncbi:hypothetical protein [Paenibacillus sp. V4I7]|uniref:hypothetical protein n=1 Tax=Paenibacillus sp. V4I7 TaxID=3042307 RepID=UPI002786F36A|nr:hypothetical protein [Paenibacillus sp. V4I7]MDQ0902763.1 hypothetical protein [Paenibacillus sp. V4I7]